MKTIGKIILLCVLVVTLATANNLLAQEQFTYIAVHFGNPEYASANNEDNFPGIAFYTTEDNCYQYSEDIRPFSKQKFLDGFYGEVPEKMGFSPNFGMASGRGGAIFVIGANGVIAGQTSSSDFSQALNGFPDDYGGELKKSYNKSMKKLTKALNDVQKGKYAQLLPNNQRKHLKSTPIGELEPVKGAKVDKKQNGIIGWEVPEITVYDKDGQAHNLREICMDKNCVLVFYTMNAVKNKVGNSRDGTIEKEYYEEMPKPSRYKYGVYNAVLEVASRYMEKF